jgi:hypothetical protein
MHAIILYCSWCGHPIAVSAHWTGQDIELALHDGQVEPVRDERITCCPGCRARLDVRDLAERRPRFPIWIPTVATERPLG